MTSLYTPGATVRKIGAVRQHQPALAVKLFRLRQDKTGFRFTTAKVLMGGRTVAWRDYRGHDIGEAAVLKDFLRFQNSPLWNKCAAWDEYNVAH